jgi:hypothetical protein
MLLNINGLDRAHLPATVAFDTFILLDLMFFMGDERDGIRRTTL